MTPHQPHPGGRPSKFSEELSEAILSEIATTTKGLEEICEGDGFPNPSTVYRWIASNEEFCKKYARAKELQTEVMEAEMLEIADDGRNDWMTRKLGDEVTEVQNHEAINRSRLRIETRKWLMGKLKPKKYGEKLAIGGDPDSPLTITITPNQAGIL